MNSKPQQVILKLGSNKDLRLLSDPHCILPSTSKLKPPPTTQVASGVVKQLQVTFAYTQGTLSGPSQPNC